MSGPVTSVARVEAVQIFLKDSVYVVHLLVWIIKSPNQLTTAVYKFTTHYLMSLSIRNLVADIQGGKEAEGV